MELAEILALPGPSLVAPEPCLCARLEAKASDSDLLGEHEGTALSADTVFADAGCSSLARSVESGTPLFARLIALLARHLLDIVGASTSGPWIHPLDHGSGYHVAIGHDNCALADFALRQAFAAAASLYPPPVQAIFPPGIRDANPATLRAEFLAIAPRLRKSLQVKLFTKACQQRGIPWFPLDRYPQSLNLIQIGYGRFQRLFRTTMTDRQSHLGVQVAGGKHHTASFLRDLGFPVPKQRLAGWGHEAREAADAIGYPVVVKPERGAKGSGVHVRLTDATQVHHAVKAIGRLYPQNSAPVVVEEWVPGNDFRLLVAGGRFVSGVHRKPAQVRGDARHTVTELIRIANEDPQRGDGVTTHLVRLQLGDMERAQLRSQGIDADTVLAQGHVALLRGTANLSTGGTLEVVTERVHPDNGALAARVAAALNMEILGLDVICPDIGVSFLDGRLKIIEVNSGPGVQATPASDGSGQEARAGEILDLLFPADQRRSVPIVTVTGGPAAASVADAVSRGLTDAGYAVGLASRAGLIVRGVPWSRLEFLDTRDPAFQLLRNREVDAVVVERGYGVLQDWGVGTGGCDVAIVLDEPETLQDDATSRGTRYADRLVAMLIDCARVATVMSLDDLNCARIAATTPAERLCVVSQHGWSEAVQRQVAAGARAVVMEEAAEKGIRLITAAGTEKSEFVLELSPISMGRERLAELLHAWAACFCLGYSPVAIFPFPGDGPVSDG